MLQSLVVLGSAICECLPRIHAFLTAIGLESSLVLWIEVCPIRSRNLSIRFFWSFRCWYHIHEEFDLSGKENAEPIVPAA